MNEQQVSDPERAEAEMDRAAARLRRESVHAVKQLRAQARHLTGVLELDGPPDAGQGRTVPSEAQ